MASSTDVLGCTRGMTSNSVESMDITCRRWSEHNQRYFSKESDCCSRWSLFIRQWGSFVFSCCSTRWDYVIRYATADPKLTRGVSSDVYGLIEAVIDQILLSLSDTDTRESRPIFEIETEDIEPIRIEYGSKKTFKIYIEGLRVLLQKTVSRSSNIILTEKKINCKTGLLLERHCCFVIQSVRWIQDWKVVTDREETEGISRSEFLTSNLIALIKRVDFHIRFQISQALYIPVKKVFTIKVNDEPLGIQIQFNERSLLKESLLDQREPHLPAGIELQLIGAKKLLEDKLAALPEASIQVEEREVNVSTCIGRARGMLFLSDASDSVLYPIDFNPEKPGKVIDQEGKWYSITDIKAADNLVGLGFSEHVDVRKEGVAQEEEERCTRRDLAPCASSAEPYERTPWVAARSSFPSIKNEPEEQDA
ncbi:MAG: hypothetical protein K9M13_02100, partial [Simkaniaceae bacterium]|nr:hypothetical protein [Simkaniaceae bacterium]